MDNYDGIMKMLKDEYLSVDVSNCFSDEDGMHLWHVKAALIKEFDLDDDEIEHQTVGQMQGLIIPAAENFCEKVDHINYHSLWELCDSVSGDLAAVYDGFYDRSDSIKDEIIVELGLSEFDKFDRGILYFEEVSYDDLNYLEKMINCMHLIKEGSAAHYCGIVVIILNKVEEDSVIQICLDCGWKIKSVGGEGVVVYTKL